MELYIGGAEAQRLAGLILKTREVTHVTVNYLDLAKAYTEDLRIQYIGAFLDAGIKVALMSGHSEWERDIWFQYNPSTGTLDWDENNIPIAIRNKAIDKGRDFNDLKEESYKRFLGYKKSFMSFVARYGDRFEFVQELYIPKLGPIYAKKLREEMSEIHTVKWMTMHSELTERIIEDFNSGYVDRVGIINADTVSLNRFIHNQEYGFIRDGRKFHGVGVGASSTINPIPYFSGDCVSWISGSRFGIVTKYSGNLKMEVYAKLQDQPNLSGLKNDVINAGLDADKFLAGNRDEIDMWNLLQYARYAKDLKYLKLAREYWIPEDEKNQLLEDYRHSNSLAIAPYGTTTELQTYSDVPRSITKFCNTCALATTCPKFTPGADCAYTKSYQQLSLRTGDNLDEAAASIAQLMYQRAVDAYTAEIMQGGIPTMETTELLNNAMEALDKLAKMRKTTSSVTISGSGAGVSVIGALLSRISAPGGSDASGRQSAADRKPKVIDMQDAEILEPES